MSADLLTTIDYLFDACIFVVEDISACVPVKMVSKLRVVFALGQATDEVQQQVVLL